MAPDLETLISDAAWQPFQYEPQRDALSFIYLPREAQRRAVFAEPRFVGQAPRSQPIPVSALHKRTATAAPLHFIFHTAFCCSTLLARAFDIPGRALGHKEPGVFIGFGDMRAVGPLNAQAERALTVVLDLFARPLDAGEVQIVKPTNAANLLLPDITRLRPNTKSLLLYSNLDIYLNAIAARAMSGRAFGRRMVRQFYGQIPIADLPIGELIVHTDLQAAAHGWLMQMKLFQRIAVELGPERARTLNSDTMLSRKVETLERAGEFFGVAHAPAFWLSVADGPAFAAHAKKPDERYDDAARRETYQRTRATHGRELDQALNWATQVASGTGAPMTLGDTLLDTSR